MSFRSSRLAGFGLLRNDRRLVSTNSRVKFMLNPRLWIAVFLSIGGSYCMTQLYIKSKTREDDMFKNSDTKL